VDGATSPFDVSDYAQCITPSAARANDISVERTGTDAGIRTLCPLYSGCGRTLGHTVFCVLLHLSVHLDFLSLKCRFLK